MSDSKLPSTVIAHRVNLSAVGQNNRMLIACSNFCNFVWYSCYVVGRIFIAECAKTKLSLFIPAAHKKSANVVNKTCMESSSRYRLDVWFIVLVKIYCTGRVLSRNFLANCCSTLTIFILSPCEYITNFCSNNCVKSTTRNLNWFKI